MNSRLCAMLPTTGEIKCHIQVKQKQKSPVTRGKRGFQGFLFRPLETDMNLILAEEAGFEPAVGITPRTLSRRMT